MAHIFISYSREDKTFAYRLAADLDRLHGDVWIDREDIHAAEKWADAINRGLNECPVMILILTPASMASDNVSDEWQYFRHRNKPIIPVLLKPTDIHFQLASLQYIDFYAQDYDTAFEQLHSELLRQGILLAPLHVRETLVPIPAQQPLPVRPQDLTRRVIWSSTFIAAGIILAAVLSLLGVFGGGGDHLPPPTQTEAQAVATVTAEPGATFTSEPTQTPLPTTALTLTNTPTAAVNSADDGQPDLYVSTFSLDPATPIQGRTVNVRVGVYNQGTAAAYGSFHIEWYAGENYPSPACTWDLDGMVAHGGRILMCTYPGYPSWYGSINTKVVVDSYNVVSESNESNNTYLQTISVSKP
jgi:hypothetical protein